MTGPAHHAATLADGPSARGLGMRAALIGAGVAIALCGAWVVWQAVTLREGPGYAAVGPRVFPVIVGSGFVLSGLLLLAGELRGTGVAKGEAPAEPVDWRALLLSGGILAAYVAGFQPLGFPLASAIFLVAEAWALGSRSPRRDLVAAVLVTAVTFFVFTRLLGLELPAGPLDVPLRELRLPPSA